MTNEELVEVIDALALALTNEGYVWSSELRSMYENAIEFLTIPDPTEGLPEDLVRVLRDPTITIPRDHEIKLADGRTLFEHLEEWRNAPSNTASA